MGDDLNFIKNTKILNVFLLAEHLSLLVAPASPELGTAQPQLVWV
jgi:hypothetical protein